MGNAGGLRGVMAQIDKQYGKNTIMVASEAKALQLHRIPIGIPSLDIALGGGMPRGRIVMAKGDFSSGKTLLALKTLKRYQQTCRICGKLWEKISPFTGELLDSDCRCKKPEPMQAVWLDVEGSWENDWARKQGINLDQVYVIRPSYTEQGLDVADAVIRSKECDLIVCDSVAALAPSVEIEQSMEDQQMGVQARLMNKALRKWTSALNAGYKDENGKLQGGLDSIIGDPTIFLINQMRVKLGVTFGSNETTPGGMGQGYHSSIIIRMAHRGLIKVETGRKDPQFSSKNEELAIGKNMGFDIPKNKTAPPHASGIFDFYFKDYPDLGIVAGDIDIAAQILAYGQKYNFVEKKGAWYSAGDQRLGQGKVKAKEALMEQPELCQEIYEKACLTELGFVA